MISEMAFHLYTQLSVTALLLCMHRAYTMPARRFLFRASNPENNPTTPRNVLQPKAAKAPSSPSPFDDVDEYIKLVSTQDSPISYIFLLTIFFSLRFSSSISVTSLRSYLSWDSSSRLPQETFLTTHLRTSFPRDEPGDQSGRHSQRSAA
jgi:hypothetical protein